MQTVDLQQLKSDPSTALQSAEQELIMVTNQDQPDALLVSMNQLTDIPNLEQVRLVLGISMFRDKQLSIGAAAKVAGKPLAEMLTLVSAAGIPVADYSEEDANTEASLIERFSSDLFGASKDNFIPRGN